jgi:signal transduction histidine kinase
VFASIGRRLALLNAAVVVAVIAVAGFATFILLRQNLDREADQALKERAEVARETWADLFVAGPAAPVRSPVAARESGDDDRDMSEARDHDDGDDEDEDHEARELLESGDILLFAVDADGRLLVNARGTVVPELPDAAAVAVALAGAVDTRSIAIAGEPLRVYSAPVRHDDRVVGAVQAARSEREHQAELRLVGLISLIGIGLGSIIAVPAGLFLARRAMQPIDLAFARQRAFVADASHELRTPLTLIRATTELVQRLPDASPAVREELGAVLGEVDMTGRLVDDLLLLARLDSDAPPLRREVLDLGTTIRAATAPFAPLATNADLSLNVDAPPGIMAAADADRIRQIMRVLLDNAIAHTPTGGAVAVTVERQSAQARVAVRDNGAGIAPADQSRVFDRFYRVDRARSRTAGGTGLGLAIARALVLAHGGAIGLESTQGKGTTVWFTLPVLPDASSP